jgi:Icc-related predicted phosphoesterase
MRLVAISDTHGRHEELILPAGDLLIHAGDLSMNGTPREIASFMEWFKGQDFQHKVFIAGNHDFFFERAQPNEIENIIPADVHYLQDSTVNINQYTLWGSPVQPWFFDWAFNRQRGEDIAKHWKKIPEVVDIVITHGPPRDILDRTTHREHVGCDDLLKKIRQVEPRFHIFGHIHESYGWVQKNGTHFVNASVVDHHYKLVNQPLVFDL